MRPGVELVEVLSWAGSEAHLGERSDAIRLVLGDLTSVDDQHTGQIVTEVGGDRVLEPRERAGFRREGLLRAYQVVKGMRRDMLMYSLLRGELR